MTQHYYITTPIYYVNGAPHIGHAYTSIACDVMARYKRLCGEEVFFLTGTDEHGQKVEKTAMERGISAQDFADQISEDFRRLADELGLSHNDFIRTTEARHKKAAQTLWQRIADNGYIYEDSYSGWYSVRDEAFYGEDELIKNEAGEKLAPSGAPVEWVEEPSYFFKLSAFEEKLLAFYKQEGAVAPKSRKNEVAAFVKSGLRDLSISRTSFNWGIPVPGDETHVMYVWIDALTNYLTAIGFPDDETMFKQYWPADLHVVGKDILRFHAVYWPAFLMAAGLPTPKRIVAHGWWTNAGEKISKSLGNVIDPRELIAQYGLDAVRYYLMREVPFGNDGNFTHASMVGRINSDLANNIGNLAQRTLSMIYKNCEATLPSNETGVATVPEPQGGMEAFRLAMEKQRFHEALEWIAAYAGEANAYIDEQAPWVLKKSDPAAMRSVLYELAEAIRRVAILLQAFVPTSAGKILDALDVPADARTMAHLGAEHALRAGVTIDKPTPVFPRYEEEKPA